MFVQIIQGQSNDPQALRRQMERWGDELMSGAEGFLGSTAGISEAGELLVAARFEDEDSARANAEREEQSRWWAEAEKLLEGEARFYDCTEVELRRGGGSDDAGFVQALQATAKDKDRLRSLSDEFEGHLEDVRQEYLGGLLAWQGDDFTILNYFTKESEARRGEDAAEMQAFAEQRQRLLDNVKWIDLKDPILLTKKGA